MQKNILGWRDSILRVDCHLIRGEFITRLITRFYFNHLQKRLYWDFN